MDIYKNKYLKYKSRYLALKNQRGGELSQDVKSALDIMASNSDLFMKWLLHLKDNNKLDEYYHAIEYRQFEDWKKCTLTEKGSQITPDLIKFNLGLGASSRHYEDNSLPHTLNISFSEIMRIPSPLKRKEEGIDKEFEYAIENAKSDSKKFKNNLESYNNVKNTFYELMKQYFAPTQVRYPVSATIKDDLTEEQQTTFFADWEIVIYGHRQMKVILADK